VQLYTYFRSSAAYRVRIALNLKGLTSEMIPIHLQKQGGMNKKPEYRAVNPQMRLPALKLDCAPGRFVPAGNLQEARLRFERATGPTLIVFLIAGIALAAWFDAPEPQR